MRQLMPLPIKRSALLIEKLDLPLLQPINFKASDPSPPHTGLCSVTESWAVNLSALTLLPRMLLVMIASWYLMTHSISLSCDIIQTDLMIGCALTMLTKPNECLDGFKSQKSHKHQNVRGREKKILINYWEQMMYYSCYFMKAWDIKAANESVSVKPLTLNKASVGLRNRTGRAEEHEEVWVTAATNPAACPVSVPDLIKNCQITWPSLPLIWHHTHYHLFYISFKVRSLHRAHVLLVCCSFIAYEM